MSRTPRYLRAPKAGLGPFTLVGANHPVLHARAREVTERDDIRAISQRMLATLTHHPEGLALAAPQVGISLRLVVWRDADGNPGVAINPEVSAISPPEEWEVGREGCLSLPGRWFDVPRPTRVGVRADVFDPRAGRLARAVTWIEADPLYARLWAHECEHLDGVLLAGLYPEVEPERTSA